MLNVVRRAFCSYLRRGKSNESSGVERKSNIFVNSPSRQKWHSNIRSSALTSGLYSSGPNVLLEVVLGFELTDPVLELHIAKSMPTVKHLIQHEIFRPQRVSSLALIFSPKSCYKQSRHLVTPVKLFYKVHA